ncbi:MAG: urea carboxylase [Granulosicoccus sp.]
MSSFKKVLIANRGAIATRIIRTLDKLGIASVAVYAQSDRDSLHVQRASEACSLGDGNATATYLNIDKLLDIAKQTGCDAIHPGYGFLSENTDFVDRCNTASIVFIGPTARQIEDFGQKHIARELAQAAGVPLPPGSGLLDDLDHALAEARNIGYPVMLKSTAGGGGIGMHLCASEATLIDVFSTVKRQGASNFSNDGVFLEKAITKARHIEVQMFGDGQGAVISLGERDCSAQRRNQKVVEECPAPNLSDELRNRLHRTAEALLSSVSYLNAGTVEFILDIATNEFYFLEVNTRLQVEHGVTEMVFDIDLVNWMVRQAASDLPPLHELAADLSPKGHAVQVRIYAEDPYRQFQPCAGPLTRVSFPTGDGLRIDHWIESGISIPADFDPMLAKVIVHASSRDQALRQLQTSLDEIELYGSETNVDYLRALCRDNELELGRVTTRYLDSFEYLPCRIDVIRGGTLTTIQDLPGRVGYWPVGIPPSGPFDSLSFKLANQLLGNDASAAGLEVTLQGPALRFSSSTQLVVGGGAVDITLDGEVVKIWTVINVSAGQVLDIAALKQEGSRAYIAVKGGIQCPDYLGSKSTFVLGLFGGHNGAALKAGDVLQLTNDASGSDEYIDPQTDLHRCLNRSQRPLITNTWSLRVVYGPHGAPDFFTEADIDMLFDTQWQVHYNSSRTGVRLIGPAPQWARSDGGEAGLHPSNIHDNAYAFGSIDFTGDMPVILGPDGPSLGGFVCPATVISADLWKLGQLRAGDTLSFDCVSVNEAVLASQQQQALIDSVVANTDQHSSNHSASETQVFAQSSSEPRQSVHQVAQSRGPETATSPVVARREEGSIQALYRVAGDSFLLVEYGELKLDLISRFRVHALMRWIEDNPINGIVEVTPGIRSLQIHYDHFHLSLDALLAYLLEAEVQLDSMDDTASVPSRIVHLPLSWDDEACRQAVIKYDQSVRKDAPWFPSNLEFIRRINGLASIEDVKKIVFDASYLVMGLGDVYLGAPVATPVNPAHRLVTTKYNPARTWTAENSVGIGGSYLCVYGMEGPGGYQFVGRTLQMWNRYKQTEEFSKPWLLRFFDQIRFYEVSHAELEQIRLDFPHGRYPLKIEEAEFSLASFQQLVIDNKESIDSFQTQREEAFSAELANWRATGQFNISQQEPEVAEVTVDWPEDSVVIESPVTGSLWKRCVEPGESVLEGQTLLILESMKMEINVASPERLRVRQMLFESGQRVSAGQPLVVLESI